MKKTISILMCFTIFLSTLVFTQTSASAETYASGGFIYSILDDGTAEIKCYSQYSPRYAVIPSEINGYTVTSIADEAFYDRTKLESVTIPDSVTSIGKDAFANCSSLESITIPDSVTSIGDYAFWWCTSLTSITIPDSVTAIGYSAFAFTAYYNNKSNWEDNVLYIGKHLITGKCYSFIHAFLSGELIVDFEVVGSYSVKSETKTIANSAFLGCKRLSGIAIPNSVKYINDYVFAGCSSLTSIIIPNSVTSISKYAFVNCSLLSNITIPESITHIDENAFKNCSCLRDVYYTGTKEQWNKITISTGNNALDSANIHCKKPVVTTVKKPAPTMSKKAKPVIKLKAAKKSLTLTLTKKVELAKGYQVKYSLKKSMKGAKTKTLKANKKTLKIKKLKSKKTYYVRVRAYTKVNGKTVYGAWSQIKKVKIK